MSNLLKIYQSLLHKHPYRFQAIQTGFLMGFGDFLSQVLVEKKKAKDYNIVGTVKFASFGLFAGPNLLVWYKVLDRYVKHSGFKGVLLKVAADQTLFAPAFIAFFVSTMGTLNGESINQIQMRLNRDFSEILTTNWKVWPLVQLVNFSLVPLHYRVGVAQLVAIFWNTYLAYVTNKSTEILTDDTNQ